MKKKINIKAIEIDPYVADDIYTTIKLAYEISLLNSSAVYFRFNGVLMKIDIQPMLNDQYRYYQKRLGK